MTSPKDYKGIEVTSYTSKEIKVSEDMSPRRYLLFALTDLQSSGDERARVNALSNAKRALHFQVELIAKAYGFTKMHKRTSFYEKLEFCRKCGIVSPRILGKINKLRNAVEHDYHLPAQTEVEDFVDVVELFLSATDRYLTRFPEDIEISFDSRVSPDAPEIQGIDIYLGSVYLFVHPRQTRDLTVDDLEGWKRKHSVKIDLDDARYFEWVKLALELAQ